MASTPNANSILVFMHHNGFFFEDPLLYDSGKIKMYDGLNFVALDLVDLLNFVEEETNSVVTGLYYCGHGKPLSSGLKVLLDDRDIRDLIKLALDNNGKLDMYVDHMYTDLKKYWCKEKEKVETDTEFESNTDNDDLASLDHLSDGEDELHDARVKHKEGESETDQLVKDTFLTLLCEGYKSESFVDKVIDSDDEHVESDEEPHYPVHNPNMRWDAMKPLLGEKYENPKQLKQCLVNYGLANGYRIVYEKSDSKRLLSRCGKIKTRGVHGGCGQPG